jgi:hypothetical protein
VAQGIGKAGRTNLNRLQDQYYFGPDAHDLGLARPGVLPGDTSRTSGRIEGGITLQLTPDLGATVTAGTSFARDEGEDYRVSAGLNYRF